METFSARAVIATLALSTGIGFLVPSAHAEDHSFLIDLNTKSITELDALGGKAISAKGINNAGQVVGEFETARGAHHAFMTGPHGVSTTDLGTLPNDFGDLAYLASYIIQDLNSSANAINDKGQVVGSSDVISHPRTEGGIPQWDVLNRAFITGQNGVGMTDTIGFRHGDNDSRANAINNSGEFVEFDGAPPRAPSFGSSRMSDANGYSHDLDALSDERQVAVTHPTAINESGQVAGYSNAARFGDQYGGDIDYYHAIITGPEGAGITDLGTLGGLNSFATGINEAGQVVGYSDTAEGNTHAFITAPNGTGVTDLGTLGGSWSAATAIDDAGRVVGSSEIAGGNHHAFVTGPGGIGMFDLNGLLHLPHGVLLTEATGINNAGEIIAISVVPEPAARVLMPIGLMLLGLVAMRKRA